MGSEPAAEPGLLTRLVAAARHHPGVSVPLAAAGLAAALGFSVTTYVYAAALAVAEDLRVPQEFVAESSRVESTGRGLVVAGTLAVGGFVLVVLLERATRSLVPRRGAVRNRLLHRWLASMSPGYEFAARVLGLLAVATSVTFAWLNAVAQVAFLWTPNAIAEAWVVEETAGTPNPVLVLRDDRGAILLRPLKHLGDGRYAACGTVTMSSADDLRQLRYVGNLGRLVDGPC